MNKHNYLLSIAGLLYLCFLAKTDVTQAKIASDGTLSTQVQTTNNLDFTISNGNRVGGNLFHSFREFSVPTGGSASFANDLDVKNIFTRVTGTSISNIDGLLRTNGSANLFLINPNGIIFGLNARLNIGGSFVASTASHLLFADGTQFSATNPQTPPLLTVSVPIGLQFGQTAKPIQIEGSNLQVLPGRTLAMLGGDVLIKGDGQQPPKPPIRGLIAPEARIELGSVAGNSLVSLTPIAEGFALGYEGVQNFQDIRLFQAALITTDGAADGQSSGAIQLRGRTIAIADNSRVRGTTLGEKPGQPLALEATESVELSHFGFLTTYTMGTGAAGDITIKTRRLIVEVGIIETSTNGAGRGGNLIVNASESVEVLARNGFFARLSARTLSPEKNAGDAGTVQISTRRLILRDGGQISTSTLSEGNGGTLIVDASEFVEASGRSVVNSDDLPSGLLTQSIKVEDVAITGNGGNLIVNTPRLVVQGGASVSVASLDGSAGRAGILNINASDSITVTGTGFDAKGQVVPSMLRATSEGSGRAGDLRINTGTFTIRDGALVSVSNSRSGATGDLQITANNLLLDQGRLTATTTGGQGNINLNSGNLILRRGSQITTSARGTNITGSNITINTDVLAALEDSDISANSQDFRGGNVRINASGIFGTQLRDENTSLSDITATGKDSSLSGTVQINTPDVDPTSGLIELPANLVDSTRLIAQACPANRDNSFTITGRGGLPPSPNEPLRPNNTVLPTWVTSESPAERSTSRNRSSSERISTQDSSIPNQIVEATGWRINQKGQMELIASAPTPTYNGFWFNPLFCPE
jgi:filamentous hemagglutinin family protein